jgi:hypothetical protein
MNDALSNETDPQNETDPRTDPDGGPEVLAVIGGRHEDWFFLDE